MDARTLASYPYLFPLFFVAMWLAVTTILGFLSGWNSLQDRYPARDEPALLTLRGQSGSMGLGVSMNGILTLSACPSGLRVSMWRIFGPFWRPFLVPWSQIAAEPRTLFFVPMVRLRFGDPETGKMTIRAGAWEKLSAHGPASRTMRFATPPVPPRKLARGYVLQWAAVTVLAAIFFYFGSRMGGGKAGVPLAVCIGFPAFGFGVPQLFRYIREA